MGNYVIKLFSKTCLVPILIGHGKDGKLINSLYKAIIIWLTKSEEKIKGHSLWSPLYPKGNKKPGLDDVCIYF